MAIRGVMLDLDHTLYDYDTCNEAALEAAIKKLSEELKTSEETVREGFQQARQTVKTNLLGYAQAHSRTLYFKTLIENISGKTNSELTIEIVSLFWAEYFKHMILYPHVKEFLEFCRKKEMNTAIVTNLTTEIQLKKIVALGISGYIDHVITSEEAGKEKPSPHIYRLALSRLKCKPEEAIMVGDDCESDIIGAQNLGIRAYNICDKSQWKDYENWLNGAPSYCCTPKKT